MSIKEHMRNLAAAILFAAGAVSSPWCCYRAFAYMSPAKPSKSLPTPFRQPAGRLQETTRIVDASLHGSRRTSRRCARKTSERCFRRCDGGKLFAGSGELGRDGDEVAEGHSGESDVQSQPNQTLRQPEAQGVPSSVTTPSQKIDPAEVRPLFVGIRPWAVAAVLEDAAVDPEGCAHVRPENLHEAS